MKIKDIKSTDKNFDVEGVIVEKTLGDSTSGNKFAKCILENEGRILLWLWNEDADLYNVGDKIKIVKAYARVTQEGDVSISKSKFGGKIEKM
jgi:hypothetical protein